MTTITIAQFTDCHLFADPKALHYGALVYDNLIETLIAINEHSLDAIFFTGDLSQDHTESSYERFVEAVTIANIKTPLYFLAGNHDEPALLSRFLNRPPFNFKTDISLRNWQFLLLDSKTPTPAGEIYSEQLEAFEDAVDVDKYQFIFMHHHPISVDYFIDRHGLQKTQTFWQAIKKHQQIKAIACGHVHRALTLLPQHTGKPCPVYTCPATSIQFDPAIDGVAALSTVPGYRLFTLHDNGDIDTEVHFIEKGSKKDK